MAREGHVGQQIEEASQAMPSLRTPSVENMLNITRQSQISQEGAPQNVDPDILHSTILRILPPELRGHSVAVLEQILSREKQKGMGSAPAPAGLPSLRFSAPHTDATMQARPPQNEAASAEGALQPQQSAQIFAYQREDSNAKSSEHTESDTGKGTSETLGLKRAGSRDEPQERFKIARISQDLEANSEELRAVSNLRHLQSGGVLQGLQSQAAQSVFAPHAQGQGLQGGLNPATHSEAIQQLANILAMHPRTSVAPPGVRPSLLQEKPHLMAVPTQGSQTATTARSPLLDLQMLQASSGALRPSLQSMAVPSSAPRPVVQNMGVPGNAPRPTLPSLGLPGNAPRPILASLGISSSTTRPTLQSMGLPSSAPRPILQNSGIQNLLPRPPQQGNSGVPGSGPRPALQSIGPGMEPRMLAPLLVNSNLATMVATGNIPQNTAAFNPGQVGHAQSQLQANLLQQIKADPQAATALNKPGGRNLAAFGSIISAGQADSAAQGNATEKGMSVLERLKHKAMPGAARNPGNPGSKPGDSTITPLPLGGPDPRILDWVLGNRPTIMDKPAGAGQAWGNAPAQPPVSMAPASASTTPVEFPRTMTSSAPSSSNLTKEASGPTVDPNSTLRRPVAIRASVPQVPILPSSTAMNLQALANASQKMPEVSAAQGSDIGRVVQWAGQELALRDCKVREAERLREEERVVHDAAMSAVATEVMRIKAGQQELAKTHWNLQDMLAKKTAEWVKATAELEESKTLLGRLTGAISELNHHCDRISMDANCLREENKLLRQRIAVHDPSFLQPVNNSGAEGQAGNVTNDQALPVSTVKEEAEAPPETAAPEQPAAPAQPTAQVPSEGPSQPNPEPPVAPSEAPMEAPAQEQKVAEEEEGRAA